MRAFLTSLVVLVALAVTAGFVTRGEAKNASSAFSTNGVRLDPINVTNNLGRMPPHVEHK